jgi:hypothetical protein
MPLAARSFRTACESVLQLAGSKLLALNYYLTC